MQQRLLFLFFLLALLANAKAQDSSTTFEPATKKWEIGVNLLSVFKMPTEVASGLIAKRYIQTSEGSRAIRLKIAPAYLYGSSKWLTDYNTSPSISAAVGFEWQKKHGRFVPFYGGEIFYNYALLKNANDTITTQRQRSFDLGGSAFIGAQYYITKDLSLSIESHLKYTYNHVLIGTTTVAADNYLRKLNLRPIYAFYFNYHF